jgi:hypothetical protein
MRIEPTIGRARFRAAMGTVIALCLAVALTGCDALAGANVRPPKTPSSATADTVPLTQKQTKPPTSREAALTAATKAIGADQLAFFHVFEGTIPAKTLDEYEGGIWLTANHAELDSLRSNADFDGAIGKVSLWFPEYKRSSTLPLKSGGRSYSFGLVQTLGCLQFRWKFAYQSDAAPPAPTATESFPYDITVQYEPSKRVWLVTNLTELSDQAGAHKCPLAGPATTASDAHVWPTQVAGPAPTNDQDALMAANMTISADNLATFEAYQGRIPSEALGAFEAEGYFQTSVDSILQTLFGQNFLGVSGSADLWIPDYALSKVSPLIAQDSGAVYNDFGVVEMFGCYKIRWMTVEYGDGPKAPSGAYIPTELVVRYDPPTQVWLIIDGVDLTVSRDVPMCASNTT